MPTAEAALEWKTENLEAQEWKETAATPVTRWAEPPVEIPVKVAKSGVVADRTTVPEKLAAEIVRASDILKLGDNWDGEGSPRYSKETLDRSISFVTTHVSRLWELYGIEAAIPTIGPGPDGSIDIHWKLPGWELLVNIPSDLKALATFYGDDYGPQKIRGSFDASRFNLGIASWLIR